MSYYHHDEFACKDYCGLNNATPELIEMLERLCELYGKKITLNSVSRCSKHNAEIGGSPTSSHLKGLAADLSVLSSRERFKILELMYLAGFKRIEVKNTWIHVDIDSAKDKEVLWL